MNLNCLGLPLTAFAQEVCSTYETFTRYSDALYTSVSCFLGELNALQLDVERIVLTPIHAALWQSPWFHLYLFQKTQPPILARPRGCNGAGGASEVISTIVWSQSPQLSDPERSRNV
jgi:hypothetical protein